MLLGFPLEGRIYRSTSLGEKDQYYVFGLLLWMRPLTVEGCDLDSKQLAFSNEVMQLADTQCVTLKYSENTHKYILYIDKLHVHDIQRYESYSGSQLMRVINLEHTHNKLYDMRMPLRCSL